MGEAKLTRWHTNYDKGSREFQARTVKIFARVLTWKTGVEKEKMVRLTLVDETSGRRGSVEFIDMEWFTAICLGIELESYGQQIKKESAHQPETREEKP